MTDADFFASGHPVMKRLIALGPVAFGVRLGVAGALLLMLPANFAGVHTFPVGADDRGFWFEANWSLMYVVVFPAIFGGLAGMITLMRDAIRRLTGESVGVILKTDPNAPDFEQYVSTEMARRARGMTWLCVGLSLALTTVHAASLARFLITREGPPPILDWTTMFTSGRVSYGANVAFDVVAYTIEAIVIFIGFFFVLKFWLFLSLLSRAIRDEATPYKFKAHVYDPDHRLGLRPLGAFMNRYLLLVIIFELYVLGRRLQLIGKGGEFTLSSYVTTLADGARSLQRVLEPQMYQWQTIDAGLWAMLIFLTLPLVVGAYLPLWTLRLYVRKRRDDLWEQSARAHEEARERGDAPAAAELAQKMSLLEEAQLWPNGDAIGWRLLAGSVAIALAAWAPPLCVFLLAIAGGVEVAKVFFAKRVR